MDKQYGFFVSVVVHLLIFLLPVSMIGQRNVPDLELIVDINDSLAEPHEAVRSKKPLMEKKTKIEMTQENVRTADVPVLEEKTPERSDLRQEEGEPFVTAPAEQIQSQAFRLLPVETSPQSLDTEFGAAAAPSFLYREMPVYPVFARKLGKEGKVLLRLTIDERGNLLQIEVVEKAGYGFVEAAIAAVKKSTFLPAKRDGKPVASRALLPVKFTLRRS